MSIYEGCVHPKAEGEQFCERCKLGQTREYWEKRQPRLEIIPIEQERRRIPPVLPILPEIDTDLGEGNDIEDGDAGIDTDLDKGRVLN